MSQIITGDKWLHRIWGHLNTLILRNQTASKAKKHRTRAFVAGVIHAMILQLESSPDAVKGVDPRDFFHNKHTIFSFLGLLGPECSHDFLDCPKSLRTLMMRLAEYKYTEEKHYEQGINAWVDFIHDPWKGDLWGPTSLEEPEKNDPPPQKPKILHTYNTIMIARDLSEGPRENPELDPFCPHTDNEERALDDFSRRFLCDLVKKMERWPRFARHPSVWSQSQNSFRRMLSRLLSEILNDTSYTCSSGERIRMHSRMAGFSTSFPMIGLSVHDHEVFHTRGYYSASFCHPRSWVLSANSEITRSVVSRKSLGILDLMIKCAERINQGLQDAGVSEHTKLRVKGSRALHMLLKRAFDNVSSLWDQKVIEDTRDIMISLFEGGDLDIDIMINPDLPDSRFNRINDICIGVTSESLAWLKSKIDKIMTPSVVSDLQKLLKTNVPSFQSIVDRPSFIISRVFEEEYPGQQDPGKPGWGNITAFTENPVWKVGSLPHKKITLKVSPVYLSYNVLLYQNDTGYSNFTLLRCMLSCQASLRPGQKYKRRLRGEFVDVSIPLKKDMKLVKNWNAEYTNIPGTNLKTFSMNRHLDEMVETLKDRSQSFKSKKRSQRLTALAHLIGLLGKTTKERHINNLGIKCNNVLKHIHTDRLSTIKDMKSYLLSENVLNLKSNTRQAKEVQDLPYEALVDLVAVFSISLTNTSVEQRRCVVSRLHCMFQVSRKHGDLFWLPNRNMLKVMLHSSDYQMGIPLVI